MTAPDDLLAEYDRMARDGGRAVVERDVVAVEGPEAAGYLQGQLSQDVASLPVGSSAWSLVLQPTGKVDAWFRILRRADDEFVLDVDAGAGDVLAARLRRFLLRTKAQVSDPRTESFVVHRAPEGTTPPSPEADEHVVAGGPAAGPGVAGVDRAWEPGVARGITLDGPAPAEVSLVALERYRIAHGVPAMGAELTADTIPGEAGQWLIDASVSFTKGCYTGQELVARIDSRGGNVPRPIRLLAVDGGPAPVVGGEVRASGEVVGVVTSATTWLAPHRPALALAPLKRSVEPGATVEVDTETGAAAAVVVEPPFEAHGAG